MSKHIFRIDVENNKKAFAKHIEDYRKSQSMTIEDISARWDISVQTYNKWKAGTAFPSAETLLGICSELNCDMDYLLGRLTEKTHDNKFICDATGLTEAAVEELVNNNAPYVNVSKDTPDSDTYNSLSDTISFMIENLDIPFEIYKYLLLTDTIYSFGMIEDFIINDPTDTFYTKDDKGRLNIYADYVGYQSDKPFSLYVNNLAVDGTTLKEAALRRIKERLDAHQKDYRYLKNLNTMKLANNSLYRDEEMDIQKATD